MLPAVRYLIGHQAEYGYTMDGFGMFGFSAGGLMTTAYAFSDYKDCCHKHNLPRPAAIFPIYGLHWELKVHEEDKGLAIFSRVGRMTLPVLRPWRRSSGHQESAGAGKCRYRHV